MSEGLQLHPLFNACLNATSALFIALAFGAVRRGEVERHKKLMLAAFSVSCLFFVSYLIRYALHGSTPFPGQGAVRYAYFAILISHSVLAAAVPFLVIRAIYLGLKGRIAEHRPLVKVGLPAWLYVSVTGVVIYAMLYHWPR